MPRTAEIARRIALAVLLPLFPAACDDTNSGTYDPSPPSHDRQEQIYDDEQYNEHCEKHPGDCR